MHPLIGLAFALRLGTLAAYSVPAPGWIAPQTRELTTGAAFHSSPLLGARVTAGAAAGRNDLPFDLPSGPPVGPIFHRYRPHEWLARVAQGLDIGDLGITHAALWVASIPVQLDVRPGYVFMRVTLRTR
jgi:hypothetical protein